MIYQTYGVLKETIKNRNGVDILKGELVKCIIPPGRAGFGEDECYILPKTEKGRSGATVKLDLIETKVMLDQVEG
jgi:hypothetical protein